VSWTGGIGTVRFSSDGAVCGYVVIDGQARLLEAAEGREYRTLVSSLGARRGGYYQGDIGADGVLAVAMEDGTRLWDLAVSREVAYLPGRRTDSVRFVDRLEGRELLTCGFDGLRRWPSREGPEGPGRLRLGPPHTVPLPVLPTRADVSPDGRTVAVASESSGTALVVDLPTEAVRCTLAPHPALCYIALSADGRWAATSGWHSDRVKVWDARTGTMVKELRLGQVTLASFTPEGRSLVTSRSGEYRFWDVPSWRPARRSST
jgi:WD40 repeat protein